MKTIRECFKNKTYNKCLIISTCSKACENIWYSKTLIKVIDSKIRNNYTVNLKNLILKKKSKDFSENDIKFQSQTDRQIVIDFGNITVTTANCGSFMY